MENMSFKNQRKRRKRSQRRKLLPSDSPLDLAEARREIVNALHIHRSSSWRFSSRCTKQENSLNYNTNMFSYSGNNIVVSSQLYYPLVESVQVPEPIWSTTEPAAAAPPLDHQVLEFEWPENSLSSSYTWWLGFLRSLDSGKDGSSNQPSKYYYSCQGNVSAAGSEMDTVSSDRQKEQSPSPETYEWLTITASEDDEVELL